VTLQFHKEDTSVTPEPVGTSGEDFETLFREMAIEREDCLHTFTAHGLE
jgi:hypothetical protein